MKAELLKHLKDIVIIDITHQIRLNNTIEAAFVCNQLQKHENQNDIVIVKVGAGKDLLVYQHLLNLYIFPNNGLLSMVFPEFDPAQVRIIPYGEDVKAIRAFQDKQLHLLPLAGNRQLIRYVKNTQITGGMALAECLHSDGHGNCYFNIRREVFEDFVKGNAFNIRIQHYTGHVFRSIGKHITDADPGEALFRFSKSGYLKLQINLGNARQLFRIKDDTKIIIELQ